VAQPELALSRRRARKVPQRRLQLIAAESLEAAEPAEAAAVKAAAVKAAVVKAAAVKVVEVIAARPSLVRQVR
jgi:hypothetical protein